jgi:hypothetical protein
MRLDHADGRRCSVASFVTPAMQDLLGIAKLPGDAARRSA